MAIGAAMAIFLAVTTGFFGHGFVDDSWIGLR